LILLRHAAEICEVQIECIDNFDSNYMSVM